MFNFTIDRNDILKLCRAFGGNAFRPLMSELPNFFKNGDQLNDQDIITVVTNNYQNSVVRDYLYQLVYVEIHLVKRNTAQLKALGQNELDSLSYALLCSLFKNALDYYLKYAKVSLKPAALKAIRKYIADFGNHNYSIDTKLKSLSQAQAQATSAKSNAPAPKKNEPQSKTVSSAQSSAEETHPISFTALSKLNDDIEIARQSKMAIEQSVRAHKQNLANLEDLIKEKTAELNNITQQIDKKNNELEYQARLAEQQKSQTQAGVVDTSKDLDSIKDEHTSKEVDEKTTELERIGKQIDEKNAELEGIGKQIDEKNSELEGIGKQIDAKNAELEGIDKQIDAKNAELQGITQQIDKSTNQLGYQATIVDQRSKETDSEVVDASKDLASIKAEIASKTKELTELKHQTSKYASDFKALEGFIQDAQSTYANLQGKIKAAQLHAGDAAPAPEASLHAEVEAQSAAVVSSNEIATPSAVSTDMAVAVPAVAPAVVPAVVGDVGVVAGAVGGMAVGCASYQISTVALSEAGQTLTSWDQVIEELADNLACSGVNSSHIDDCCTGLAVFMLSAYLLKQPILLVGPNASEIIEAFCSTLDDGRYGILSCDGPYNPQAIESIGLNNESIVVINNLLSSSWTNRIHEILSKKDVFFIAVHPYKEDLQVEPSSLYNYFMPVCTEFVVSDIPHGDFVGGHPHVSLSFNENDKNAPRALGFNMLSKFAPSPIAIKRIKRVLSTMLALTQTKSEEGKSLYCSQLLLSVAPLAYASQSLDTFFELMHEPNSNNEKDFNKVTQLLNFLSGSDD